MTLDVAFDTPALLWLLPLALALPLARTPGTPLVNGWLALAPRDGPSRAIDLLLRAAAVLTLAALLLAAAGPYRPEYTVERIGRGAEIVLVLDRSRSMDQGFAPTRVPKAPANGRLTPEMLEQAFSQAPARLQPKGRVARQMLAEFVRQRPQDRFALVVFSTLAMRVLDFTAQPQMIQAAIEAGNIGRGLSETNIGLAVEAGLSMFEGRPYNGSRILLLVSDGGDRLDAATREQLAQQARKQRVAIDWLYLRGANSPLLEEADSHASPDSVPELSLHRFFESLDTPYRAYEASDPQALQRAIDDVNRQQKLPIVYRDLVPRRDLTAPLLSIALAGVLLLGAARVFELRRWAS